MLSLTSEQASVVSVGPSRQLGSVIAGLGAGSLAAVTLLTIAPSSQILPMDSLVRALFYSSTVFLAAGATTLLTLRSKMFSQNFSIALRTAATAIWLAPLATVSQRKSWFAIMPWVVFCVEVARLIGYLRSRSDIDDKNYQSAEVMFWFPSQNWRPTLLSLEGAFLFQLAVIAAIGWHAIAAVFLGILSTATLIWRGVWMLEASPPTNFRWSARKIFNLISVTTILILLSWLPYVVPRGDFRSLAMLWKLFTASPSHFLSTSTIQRDASKEQEGGGSRLMPGDVFPGVILYPRLKPRVTLIAPPPQALAGPGTSHAEPLSIPFNGVYWLWRFPEDGLPASAVRKYGNPDAMGFRSTDGSSLWMEAHQNLGTAITLKCCSAIQVVIDNADLQPGAVAMELLLRNNAVAGKPYASLGACNVSARADVKAAAPLSQTLTYHIPDQVKLEKFDEVKVVFRLEWKRRDQSAKIAINRFVLVPAS